MLKLRFACCVVGIALGPALQSVAQQQPPVPPTTPQNPVVPRTVHVVRPQSSNVSVLTNRPVRPFVSGQRVLPASAQPLPQGFLAWDSETQQSSIPFGTPQATFEFSVTNVSETNIVVNRVHTSCGCTVAKVPPLPWTLAPGANGEIDVTMNVAGKSGVVVKSVSVQTDQGSKTVYVRTTIAPPPAGVMGQEQRMRNLQIAMRNRQAVFQGECATCHTKTTDEKGQPLTGKALYTSLCGVCHEAEHRASMVPDLHHLQKDTPADYWRTWITSSADGKMMPAFSLAHGGILNDNQIESLVDYLVEAIPSDGSNSFIKFDPTEPPESTAVKPTDSQQQSARRAMLK